MMFFFEAMMKKIDHADKVRTLRENAQSAKNLGETECRECGTCCVVRTCEFKPAEFVKLAKHLKMTPKELFNKYFAFDVYPLEVGDYVIYPRLVNADQTEFIGEAIPTLRTYDLADCILQESQIKGNESSLCTIYEARPESSRLQICWGETDEEEYPHPAREWKDFDWSEFEIEIPGKEEFV